MLKSVCPPSKALNQLSFLLEKARFSHLNGKHNSGQERSEIHFQLIINRLADSTQLRMVAHEDTLPMEQLALPGMDVLVYECISERKQGKQLD
jgi:hypothetical protein